VRLEDADGREELAARGGEVGVQHDLDGVAARDGGDGEREVLERVEVGRTHE